MNDGVLKNEYALSLIQTEVQFRVDGLLPVNHVIVYGHAWAPEVKNTQSAVVVPFLKF